MRPSRIFALVVAASALECDAWAQPAISAVLNGASYSAVVAPGAWVAIFGTPGRDFAECVGFIVEFAGKSIGQPEQCDGARL